MYKILPSLLVFAFAIASQSLEAASSVYKCTNNGSVTYQSEPCPSGESKPAPTVEQLNAERKKMLLQPPNGTLGSNSTSSRVPPDAATAPVAIPDNRFKCDGRRHCTQMTSCSEAKYFLDHCPGVKMDGDRDGIPCEEQWCNSAPR
jgi:hypothetical protein